MEDKAKQLGQEPINPNSILNDECSNFIEYKGLTKREYFAGMVMQGMLTGETEEWFLNPYNLAIQAVKRADALLKELSK